MNVDHQESLLGRNCEAVMEEQESAHTHRGSGRFSVVAASSTGSEFIRKKQKKLCGTGLDKNKIKAKTVFILLVF